MAPIQNNPTHIPFTEIKCVVFDFGFTLSSEFYFNVTPPGYPHWLDTIQKQIFGDPHIMEQWMTGGITLVEIAAIISPYFDMDIPVIVETMEKGCEHLRINQAVWDFAVAQRNMGRKTALVTCNMDVFTKVVVPNHGLREVFDIIINTSDYHEIHKERLWPVAFQILGDDIHYGNSLLIEDGDYEPALFRKLGGYAYQYSTDALFTEWLRAVQ
jgi:hypothetical protein